MASAGIVVAMGQATVDFEGLRQAGLGYAVVMTQTGRVTLDPAVMGGKPCIRGMRVTVGMIVEALAAGRSEEDLLCDYPYLEREDIRAALAYAAQLAQGHEVRLAS